MTRREANSPLILKLTERTADLRQYLVGTDDEPRVGALAAPARAVIAPLIKALFNVHVVGAERIPRSGGVIISANHRSFFDTPLLMATAPRPVTFLGKAEYMDSALTKFLFPAMGMVPIRRDVKKASVAALETAAGLLNDGEMVGIYPEGTRSRDGLLHRGKTGVAQLALMTGAPIVPVGLIGTQHAQPIGARFPAPFRGRIRVEFGHPVYPDSFRYGGGRKRRQHILADVMSAIAAMSNQQVSDEFSVHSNSLMWGGTESVYQVTYHGANGLSFRHATERAVDDALTRYDDGRVAEVRRLRCYVADDGRIQFDSLVSVSSRFRRGAPVADANVANQEESP